MFIETMKCRLLFALLLSAASAQSAETLNRQKLAHAIYLAEGGARAKVPYGILSVKVRDAAEARQVCLRTIDRAWSDYSSLRSPASGFIPFLADRYCPPADAPGNRNWKRNVSYFYSK